jgi:hypothetical protein
VGWLVSDCWLWLWRCFDFRFSPYVSSVGISAVVHL